MPYLWDAHPGEHKHRLTHQANKKQYFDNKAKQTLDLKTLLNEAERQGAGKVTADYSTSYCDPS